MARIDMHPLGSELDAVLSESDQERNRARIDELDAALFEKIGTVGAGWGPRYADRVHAKGKMTTPERIDALIDPGSEVFPLGTLVNWGVEFAGSKKLAPGAGVVTVLARIAERWTVVIANDNTVASGAWWPKTPEKIERAQQVALQLRLPVVYLVDCSGLFLPEQSRSFSGRTGAGNIFTHNARLAAAGVPQIAAVFGDCIAGGGYMPIISDRVVMTEGAYVVIAGAALIRGAKSLKLTSLDIGGPEVHVHQSRVADVRVPDDQTAIRMLRKEVELTPSSGAGFYRHGVAPMPPRFGSEELNAIFPADSRLTYDINEVIARLVDASLFHEFLPNSGREMVTGVARIGGLWVGLIANRQGIIDEPGQGKRAGGVLYREGIAKISTFARTMAEDGIPLIWLQDISGFDIGVQAEAVGLLGYGSSLIYSNSTTTVPTFTVLLRKASGAGYYAMAGHPYEPVVQLATPITRLAVMEGRTLAIAAFNSKLDDDFEIATTDPEERAKIEAGMKSTAARIEADMDPIGAASRMDVDEVVPLGKLRAWLECLVESAWQSTGYRRTRNPRIWSMHDLEVLTGHAQQSETRAAAKLPDGLGAPTVGQWVPALSEGSQIKPGQLLGTIRRAGRQLGVLAPQSLRIAERTVSGLRSGGNVEYGTPLFQLVESRVGESVSEEQTLAAEAGHAVVADTDGTFYARPEPGSPAFASVGSEVVPTTTVGLVEVMKTFSPVRAGIAGTIRQVLVEDGEAVSAGAKLFVVDPA